MTCIGKAYVYSKYTLKVNFRRSDTVKMFATQLPSLYFQRHAKCHSLALAIHNLTSYFAHNSPRQEVDQVQGRRCGHDDSKKYCLLCHGWLQ